MMYLMTFSNSFIVWLREILILIVIRSSYGGMKTQTVTAYLRLTASIQEYVQGFQVKLVRKYLKQIK